MASEEILKDHIIAYQKKALIMANELIASYGIAADQMEQLLVAHMQSTEQDRVVLLMQTLSFIEGIFGAIANTGDTSNLHNAVNAVLKNVARVKCAIQPQAE